MVNITKTVTAAVQAGGTLYVASKVVDTASQLAINFMPAMIPKAATVLLAGLGISMGLRQFGKGKFIHEAADYTAAIAVANAIRNIEMVDKGIDKLLVPIKSIGATPATKALLQASTKGYMEMGDFGEEMAGYEDENGMRGYTALQVF